MVVNNNLLEKKAETDCDYRRFLPMINGGMVNTKNEFLQSSQIFIA